MRSILIALSIAFALLVPANAGYGSERCPRCNNYATYITTKCDNGYCYQVYCGL